MGNDVNVLCGQLVVQTCTYQNQSSHATCFRYRCISHYLLRWDFRYSLIKRSFFRIWKNKTKICYLFHFLSLSIWNDQEPNLVRLHKSCSGLRLLYLRKQLLIIDCLFKVRLAISLSFFLSFFFFLHVFIMFGCARFMITYNNRECSKVLVFRPLKTQLD